MTSTTQRLIRCFENAVHARAFANTTDPQAYKEIMKEYRAAKRALFANLRAVKAPCESLVPRAVEDML